MAGRNPRWVTVMGTAVGAFLAAATMTTGSVVTASPAKADIIDLLDPIIAPLVTSLADTLAGVDPAAATDLTSLFDLSGLSLSSVDPAAALAAALEPASLTSAASGSNIDIPLTIAETTEPSVEVSVNGGSEVAALVDTGSSGLVIPWQDVGLSDLASLGFPVGIGVSGYSGGVDYLYLTFDTTVNYGGGDLITNSTPVDVELLSWPTSLGSPLDFQQFLSDDGVNAILGVGSNAGGPGTSPLEAAGYQGVTIDEPAGELILGSNPYTANDVTLSGAPLTNLEVSINGGTPQSVTADIDSGGVYGTIPESVTGGSSTLPAGTTVTVESSSGTPLYSYITTTTNDPTVVSSGSVMDTGYEPFSQDPIYIDYSNDTTTFDLSS